MEWEYGMSRWGIQLQGNSINRRLKNSGSFLYKVCCCHVAHDIHHAQRRLTVLGNCLNVQIPCMHCLSALLSRIEGTLESHGHVLISTTQKRVAITNTAFPDQSDKRECSECQAQEWFSHKQSGVSHVMLPDS